MLYDNGLPRVFPHARPGGADSGILLYVMGPSGAGKDSLINHAREAFSGFRHEGRRIRFAKRRITRPANSGGEDHCPVSMEDFAALEAAGEFCMHWQSHGLCYGVSREINAWLAKGDLVVVNGSRAYLPVAEKLFGSLVPMLITVRADVLRKRLESRGRENAEAIRERLSRAALPVEARNALIELDNSASLDAAQRTFQAVLARLLIGASRDKRRPDRQERQLFQARK